MSIYHTSISQENMWYHKYSRRRFSMGRCIFDRTEEAPWFSPNIIHSEQPDLYMCYSLHRTGSTPETIQDIQHPANCPCRYPPLTGNPQWVNPGSGVTSVQALRVRDNGTIWEKFRIRPQYFIISHKLNVTSPPALLSATSGQAAHRIIFQPVSVVSGIWAL